MNQHSIIPMGPVLPKSKGEATRQRIIKAANAEFSEKGFGGAGFRNIAKRADTSIGLITYHFKTKEDLWLAVIADLFNRLEDALGKNLDRSPSEPEEMWQEFLDWLEKYAIYSRDHPDHLQILSDLGATELSDATSRSIREIMSKSLVTFVDKISALQQQGFLPGDATPETLIVLINVLCQDIYHRRLEMIAALGHDPTDPDNFGMYQKLIRKIFISLSDSNAS